MAKNNWNGFVVKAIVFLVIAAGFDFLVGKIYRRLESKALEHSPYGMLTEYTMWKVDADVIIIGSSEAQHSYIPSLLEERLGMSVYNCGKEGCYFYYENAMINGILDRYNPKMIIWAIGPNYLNEPTEEDKGNLSQLNPFYKENEFCRQALKTKSKYEPVKLVSSSYTYNSRLFPYLYKIFMPDYQYEYGGYAPLYECQKNIEIKERIWNDSYDESICFVFDQTIERCLDNGVQIVFVFTPRLEIENHEDLTSYRSLIETKKKYNLCLIEDLYHSEKLMTPELFKDNPHLNHEGAKLFTSMLADEIIALK